jgi:hypothetical protein
MDITFDSIPVYDDKAGCMRFAGRYADTRGRAHLAICRVTQDFLVQACHLVEPTPEQLLRAFSSQFTTIQNLATSQVRAGVEKPFIDVDVAAVEPYGAVGFTVGPEGFMLRESYLGIEFSVTQKSDGTCTWRMARTGNPKRPFETSGSVVGGQNEGILAARKAIGRLVELR